MIKDILLNLSADSQQDVAIDYAVSLANAFDARVTGVAFAYEKMPTGFLGDERWVGSVEQLHKEADEAAQASVARFENAARSAGITMETRRIETTFSGTADEFGRMARRYDLSVVRQARPGTGTSDHLIVEAALFDSGRPVLIVPRAHKGAASFNRIALCWDGSRAAARAAADAFPFLRFAKAIEIVTVENQTTDNEIPGADLVDHLMQHGLAAEARRIAVSGVDVPSRIISYAADASTNLLVMGAYGHSRLREFVLGGATRGVLAGMLVPTLMSH